MRHLHRDSGISSIDITLVHPGERVRIANILDITEPASRKALITTTQACWDPYIVPGLGEQMPSGELLSLRWVRLKASTAV